MATYRFVHAGAFFGPESEAQMSPLVRDQFLAVLVDGGETATSMLFHAGTANAVGLALWPEGFKPKPEAAVVTNIDVQALSTACHARG